ncbi:MAG: VWA domain-containing protein [Pseudomonadota bacterium]
MAHERPAAATNGSARPAANIAIGRADGGRMAENIMHFARLLRAAGLRIGPDRTALATEAVMATGLDDPRRLYWTLHASFVTRRSDREIFNQAFVMFWKDPGYLEQMLSLVVPSLRGNVEASDRALSRRLSESLFRRGDAPPARPEDQVEIDARGTFSQSETFQTKDFEEMSAAELAVARQAIRQLVLPFDRIKTRRYRRSSRRDRLDLRAVLRESVRRTPGDLQPQWAARMVRRPPLVILADVSGSMETYARILLHFVHALTNDRDRVSVFLFAMRLSNITRLLRNRDPDVAISEVGRRVTDWSGGTRIGTALGEFNRLWARRVLGQNATVLMISDGLDRDGADGLEPAVRRLRANCRRLIWLNPLMRYESYAPIAQGAEVLAQYAHEQRACHNLASLKALASALGRGS